MIIKLKKLLESTDYNLINSNGNKSSSLAKHKNAIEKNNDNFKNKSFQNKDSFYMIKAKESPAFLKRGQKPINKWFRETKDHEKYVDRVLHNSKKY